MFAFKEYHKIRKKSSIFHAFFIFQLLLMQREKLKE